MLKHIVSPEYHHNSIDTLPSYHPNPLPLHYQKVQQSKEGWCHGIEAEKLYMSELTHENKLHKRSQFYNTQFVQTCHETLSMIMHMNNYRTSDLSHVYNFFLSYLRYKETKN